MEHVVFFPTPEGSPAFRRVSSLEAAVRLVEHLRNVEGVAEVAVHPLGAEVPLAFRAWYRVEVPGAVPGQPAAVDSAAGPAPLAAADGLPAGEPSEAPVEAVTEVPVEPLVPCQPEPVAAGPVPAVAGHGHAPDGVRSLGFFA